ncbi:CLUMA_CG020571, isoform A, partial [Clunio marinus]
MSFLTKEHYEGLFSIKIVPKNVCDDRHQTAFGLPLKCEWKSGKIRKKKEKNSEDRSKAHDKALVILESFNFETFVVSIRMSKREKRKEIKEKFTDKKKNLGLVLKAQKVLHMIRNDESFMILINLDSTRIIDFESTPNKN